MLRRSLWKYVALAALLLILGSAGVIYIYAGGRAGASAGSDEGEEKKGDEAVPVHVAEPVSGPISSYITATANLVPENEVQVLSEVEGLVSRLLVEEGDWVRKDQLLASLDREEAEIAHRKARLRADNASLAHDRGITMHDEGLISQEELDRLTMEDRVAQEEEVEARWRLGRTEIRCPFHGRLTRRAITEGQHIRPGDDLFTVTDYDPLIARIYLPERDVLDLETGREVRIRLKADPDVAFLGRVRQISPVVDTATGTVKVTVEAVEPPSLVRPGSFVSLEITRQTHAEAVLVPREAVVRELQRTYLFLADAEKEEARRVAVTLGLEEEGYVQVLSGVEAGALVVVAGQGGLKDGTKVEILEEKAEAEDEAAEADAGDPSGS